MKYTKVNVLIHFLAAWSFTSLLLKVSAQTNSTDVEALGLLQTAFPVLALISNGDPCLPTPYSWLECSSDATTPRITALNLSGARLYTESLPDFSAMDALEIIDFSNNRITQRYSEFLAYFPNLQVLNLENNSLNKQLHT